MTDCQHDERFSGVFDLPKDCRGCLACFTERQAEQLAMVAVQMERIKMLVKKLELSIDAVIDETKH